MITDEKLIAELTNIAEQNGGTIRPDDVVTAAQPEESPLHSFFDWNDSEAAYKYRLWQARQLIRVMVTYVGDGENKTPTRVFVSLTTDRKSGNGYRSIVSVLSDTERRRQLLADALTEMLGFQKKYAALKELAAVFSAMSNVIAERGAQISFPMEFKK